MYKAAIIILLVSLVAIQAKALKHCGVTVTIAAAEKPQQKTDDKNVPEI